MKTILIFLIFVVSGPLMAEELIVFERIGFSEKPVAAEAKKEILKSVIEEISEEQISSIIGDEGFRKNQGVLKSRVIRNSGKYIPFIKTKDFKVGNEQSEMMVMLKFSMKSLRKILLDNGLLYANQSIPTIINFVTFDDRVSSETYRWWESSTSQSSQKLEKLALKVESSFRKSFADQGFYMMASMDQNHKNMLPQSMVKNFRSASIYQMAEFLESDILVDGKISIVGHRDLMDQSKLIVNVFLRNRLNGRLMAQISRQIDSGKIEKTEMDKQLKEMSDDLASLLLKSWQKGVFGANVLRVSLLGPVKYPELNEFKTTVMKKARHIKRLRERLLGSDKVVFEADVKGAPEQIAKVIEGTEFDGFSLKLVEINANEVVFKSNSKLN